MKIVIGLSGESMHVWLCCCCAGSTATVLVFALAELDCCMALAAALDEARVIAWPLMLLEAIEDFGACCLCCAPVVVLRHWSEARP